MGLKYLSLIGNRNIKQTCWSRTSKLNTILLTSTCFVNSHLRRKVLNIASRQFVHLFRQKKKKKKISYFLFFFIEVLKSREEFL
jgi:hypothetical protein